MALTTGLPGEDAGTIVTGQRTVDSNTLTTVGRDVPAWLQTMVWNASEDIAPLSVMLERKGPMRSVSNRAYNHLEDDIFPQWVEIDSFSTNGDGTSFVLATGHGKRVVAGQTLRNPARDEIYLVDSVTTDTIVVTRGFGSSSATTAVAGDDLEILPMADTDGNTAPAGKSMEPSIKTNYCQIAKVAIDLSGRDLATKYINGPELPYALKKQTDNLQSQVEKAILHGARNTSSPTATGGLDYYITTNNTNIGGALTEATIYTELKKFHRRNHGVSSSSLIQFAGELVLDAYDSIHRQFLQTKPDDEVLGVKVRRLKSSHGELAIANHGQLTVNSVNAGMAYNVNLDKIELVQLGNRGMKYFPNIETPGTDGRKDYFLKDFGVALKTEKSHSRWTGVTG